MSTFRLNSKSIFLTYPQCSYPLPDFIQNIESLFGTNIEKCIAAQEHHADGNTHLHAAICLKNPLQTKNARFFDLLAQAHPNIMGRFTGGWKKAFKYVMKEGNFLTLPKDLDLNLLLKKKDSKTEMICELVRSGAGLDAIDDEAPGYMLQHLRAVQHYHSFFELKKKRSEFAMAQALKVRVKPAELYSSDWNQAIASWLSTNIRQKREHRQKQLWIKAPGGVGKTTTMMNLERIFKLSIYWWPKDEKWWDGYSDGAFDLIVLDEFRAQKMITELNPILSGDPHPCSRRNAPPLVKRDNLPVIILSNFSPMECYHKAPMSALNPLLDRLEYVEIPEGGLLRIEEETATPYASDDDPVVNFDENPNVFTEALDDNDLSEEFISSFAPAGISVFDHSYRLHGKTALHIQSQSEESFAAADARYIMLD